MAEDEKNKVTSLAPPPTDEIDDEWGSKPKQDKPAVKTTAKATPAASHDEDEDEDDDEDDDDDDRDEDDEDDDDDDDDEDDHPRASARHKERGSQSASQDWLPEWSPWAVLGGLVTIGLLGGIGVIPVNFSLKQAAPEPAAAVAATAAPTTTAPRPAGSVKRPMPPGPDGAAAQERVAASHLLVQYKGSARAAPTITRTKEEAKKRAEEAAAKAKKGVPFDKLVTEYSDEPGAAARGGKLGKFPRQAMVPAFADAAFALKPGQVSGVVETQFGYHVILRTE